MRVLMSTFMFVSLVTSTGNKSFCQKGTYMVVQTNGQFACNPCPRGTFNDENEYDKTSCKPCLKVSNSNPHYKVKLECTPEHNADIECAQGFYRDWYFPNDPCRVCKNCSLSRYFVDKPCTANNNTVCCPEEGKECATSTKPPPRKTPKHNLRVQCNDTVLKANLNTARDSNGCLQGEFYVCDAHNGSVFCSPCPRGTFMNHSLHFEQSCMQCTPRHENSDMLQNCTRQYKKGSHIALCHLFILKKPYCLVPYKSII
ncbi:hypothetical protein RRG08_011098 [Elysia crispata]|uniref:TNFR-Cys domain-containing protein n=1 Tax=Elysia crispata TaxID=231223 RepID=A0AAE1ANK8_9GAST|nr:hypothetical protein RRG08_011098 [Elysia crispata]